MNQNKTTIYNSENENDEILFDNILHDLNIETKKTIITIATLGLWNGNRVGYKILCHNLKDVIGCDQSVDTFELYYDYEDKELKATGIHHDGTNNYMFREIKDESTIYHFTDLLISKNELDMDLVNKYTNKLSDYLIGSGLI